MSTQSHPAGPCYAKDPPTLEEQQEAAENAIIEDRMRDLLAVLRELLEDTDPCPLCGASVEGEHRQGALCERIEAEMP